MGTLNDVSKDTLKGKQIHKMADQFRLAEAQIQFIGEPFAPPATDLLDDVPVQVTDSNGVRNTFSEKKQVQVDISGGSAAGKKLSTPDGTVVGAVDASIVVDLVDGAVVVRVEASGIGTVTLALTDVGTGLDVSDTATVTFS